MATGLKVDIRLFKAELPSQPLLLIPSVDIQTRGYPIVLNDTIFYYGNSDQLSLSKMFYFMISTSGTVPLPNSVGPLFKVISIF